MSEPSTLTNSTITFYRISPDYDMEREIDICEPCNFVIEILIPYDLDCYAYRGIECDLWTNACDIYSSTGRWHEVHAHKVSLQKQPEGRVHVFNVSILPIMCGHFEYTIRIRAPKLRNPEWIWYSAYKTNGKVKVIRTANSTIFGLCNDIRQFWQWYQDACGLIHYANNADSLSRMPSASKPVSPIAGRNLVYQNESYYTNVIAYISAYMTANAYQNGIDLDSCRLLLFRLTNNSWIHDYSNIRRLLVLFTGSCLRANFLERKLKDVIVPSTTVLNPVYYLNRMKTVLSSSREATSPTSALHHVFSNSSLSYASIIRLHMDNANVYRCVPNVLLKLALLNKSANNKGSLPNDVIFDLLLSYIKTAPNEEIDPNLPFELFSLLLDTNDTLLYMYISRLLKVIYDNTSTIIKNNKSIYISNYVICGMTDILNLYTTSIRENSSYFMRNELNDTMCTEGQLSPLHLIIKFIRSIFVDKNQLRSLPKSSERRAGGPLSGPSSRVATPCCRTTRGGSLTTRIQKSKSCSNIYDALPNTTPLSTTESSLTKEKQMSKNEYTNVFLIFQQLIELFLVLKQDHPDYNDLSMLLFELSQLDRYLQVFIVKRLIRCHLHNSEEQIAILKLVDNVLRLNNTIILSIDTSLQSKIVAFFLKMFHSHHVIVSLTTLSLLEYQPNHYFWILLASGPSKYAQKFVEYLDDPFNNWTCIYSSAVMKYKEELKEKGILINGEFNFEDITMSNKYTFVMNTDHYQYDSYSESFSCTATQFMAKGQMANCTLSTTITTFSDNALATPEESSDTQSTERMVVVCESKRYAFENDPYQSSLDSSSPAVYHSSLSFYASSFIVSSRLPIKLHIESFIVYIAILMLFHS